MLGDSVDGSEAWCPKSTANRSLEPEAVRLHRTQATKDSYQQSTQGSEFEQSRRRDEKLFQARLHSLKANPCLKYLHCLAWKNAGTAPIP